MPPNWIEREPFGEDAGGAEKPPRRSDTLSFRADSEEIMGSLDTRFGVPPALQAFIDRQTLEIVSADDATKTIEFHLPSLRSTDSQNRITTVSVTWIHPDYNAQYCHYYDQVPGDLPNFYVTVDTTDLGDESLEINSLDELIAWLEKPSIP